MGYTLKKKRFTTGAPVIIPGSLSLAWVAPLTMADGSAVGTITNYFIYFSTTSVMGTDGSYSNSQSVGSAALAYVLTGLTQGQTYYLAVVAVVNGQLSTPSTEISGVAA